MEITRKSSHNLRRFWIKSCEGYTTFFSDISSLVVLNEDGGCEVTTTRPLNKTQTIKVESVLYKPVNALEKSGAESTLNLSFREYLELGQQEFLEESRERHFIGCTNK